MSHEDLAERCYEINRSNLLCRLPCINMTIISSHLNKIWHFQL